MSRHGAILRLLEGWTRNFLSLDQHGGANDELRLAVYEDLAVVVDAEEVLESDVVESHSERFTHRGWGSTGSSLGRYC